uniref:Uncharacterized protein n=1 Tax=Oryza sativa subsp. japonica TaxID=39947 RepID=Q6ZH79_ORYSJ|nr:hypothetical protein [Oryza sativa Japonica Group]BAD16893.1 hypothetical protein [Oryza sativa Japonica Group]
MKQSDNIHHTSIHVHFNKLHIHTSNKHEQIKHKQHQAQTNPAAGGRWRRGKAADAGSASPDLVEAGYGGHRSAAEEAASGSRGRGCGGGEGVGGWIRCGVGGREAREGAGGRIRLPGGQTWRHRRPGGEERRRWPDPASRWPDLATGGQEAATAWVLKAGGRQRLEASPAEAAEMETAATVGPQPPPLPPSAATAPRLQIRRPPPRLPSPMPDLAAGPPPRLPTRPCRIWRPRRRRRPRRLSAATLPLPPCRIWRLGRRRRPRWLGAAAPPLPPLPDLAAGPSPPPQPARGRRASPRHGTKKEGRDREEKSSQTGWDLKPFEVSKPHL